MKREVTLEALLDAKERRARRQEQLAAIFPDCAILCLSVNVPGPDKRLREADRVFNAGCIALRAALRESGAALRHAETLRADTGSEARFAAAMPNMEAKRLACKLEASLPWGRLLDIDVLDASGRPISRAEIGEPERGCIVCGKSGAGCASRRLHPLPDILTAFQRHASALEAEETARESAGAWADAVGDAAYEALLQEAEATPKPGLVDQINSGAHTDMDLALFLRSAAALRPYFARFAACGAEHPPASVQLSLLRPIGLQAEAAMLAATDGVNTHKGAIFTLGVLCCCCGRLHALGSDLAPQAICSEAARICEGIARELDDPNADTHGARCYRAYGAAGVRGEAAAGFPNVLLYGLPCLMAEGQPENTKLLLALLQLIAQVEDTTVLSRAGKAGAAACRMLTRRFLDAHAPADAGFLPALAQLDAAFIQGNLSPGGCADLLAASCFLYAVCAADAAKQAR